MIGTKAYEPRPWPGPPAEHPEHPEPEVRARPAALSELPGGAVAILKKCREAGGWYTWATYARGSTPRGRLVESVLVKGRRPCTEGPMAGGSWSFVVEYLDEKAEVAYFAEPGCEPVKVGILDLKRRLRTGD